MNSDSHKIRFLPRDYVGRGFEYFFAAALEPVLNLDRNPSAAIERRRQLIGSDASKLLEEVERVKLPQGRGKPRASQVKAWATDLREIRNAWAHNHMAFSVDDAIRALDALERIIEALKDDDVAIANIREMRHDLIQAYASDLSRNGAFDGAALAELAERATTYDATRDPEDLAKRNLTGKLLPMARQGLLTQEELLFLLRSCTYDAQRIRDYSRLTIDIRDVSTLLEDWLLLANVRPKYRLACCLQYWGHEAKNAAILDVKPRTPQSEFTRRLLEAILEARVDAMIEDPQRSTDLDEGKRADLLRTVVGPLREEFS
jgi:hypothetical protein